MRSTPTLTMMRFVFALILFLLTSKYGLSTSVAAASAGDARASAGWRQSQFAALFVSRPDQQADERTVVALERLVVVRVGVHHRQIGVQPARDLRLSSAPVRLILLQSVFGMTPICLVDRTPTMR